MQRRLVRILGAPLARAHPPQKADAIVVLGSRLRPDGSLTDVGEERVRAGVALWHRGLAPVLALTGGRDRLASAPIAEAVALAARARELGVPESALRLEPDSRNTADNARFLAKILLAENLRAVWIVTQPFHLRRALFWFRRAGFEPLGHLIEDGIQDRHPALAAKWIAQEWFSWTKLCFLEAVPPLRRR
jgi:uncharacterized SAM-binding protein YcdF (DUF218 family)